MTDFSKFAQNAEQEANDFLSQPNHIGPTVDKETGEVTHSDGVPLNTNPVKAVAVQTQGVSNDVVSRSLGQQLSVGDIGLLDDAEEVPVSLTCDYWTPERAGESKRILFSHFGEQEVPKLDNSGGNELIEVALFYTKVNGQVTMMANGSKRLVSSLKSIHAHQGMPLQITYQGKIKNKNNNFQSDSWGVQPLLVHTIVHTK